MIEVLLIWTCIYSSLDGILIMVGGPQDFSVSPSPLVTNWVFELSWGWAKVGGLGPGLHNIGTIKFCCPVSNQL